jgi:sulfur carrier protein
LTSSGSGTNLKRSTVLESQVVQIRVNGDAREIPDGTTVATLLQLLGLERRRVAVAVNRDVVPRSRFAARLIGAGDRVEILEAVGGGRA